jgi:hypothetical protein
LGKISVDGKSVLPITEYYISQGYCSTFLKTYLDGKGEPIPPTITKEATKMVLIAIPTRRDGSLPATCWLPAEAGVIAADDVILFSPTTAGRIARLLAKYGPVAGWSTALALAILNLYYRGFIYIVCGPRGKAKATAAV